VKSTVRSLVAIALILPAEFTYGGSYRVDPVHASGGALLQLPEPATLVLLGFALLIVAKNARRQPSDARLR
jgi:PEP-CTERM motif